LLVAGGIGGVDEGAQGAGDLAWPDRAGIGLGGVFDVPQQVSCAQLMGQAGNLVVVLVPVAGDDSTGQVGEHEAAGGSHGPVTQEVIGEQVGPGPTRMGVSSAQITDAVMISARISAFACLTAAAARPGMPCTNPGEGSAPVSAWISSAHRCTGIACAAIRYTHQACRLIP